MVGWLVSWRFIELAREEIFRYGWVIGQLAKGFRVSRTSQGRNIKGWFGGWSDGVAVALIRLVGRAREEI